MPPETHPPTRRHGCLKFLILTLLFVPMAISLFGLVSSRKVPARLEQFKADLKARGYATSPREFVKVGVPDEENAAVLWRKALQLPWQRTQETTFDSWKTIEDPSKLTEQQKQAVWNALEANQALLDALEGIAECPHFTWENQDFSKPHHEWKQPFLTGYIMRYRFLFSVAAVLAHEGDLERAIGLWTLGVRSSHHFADEPYDLFALMVGDVVRGIARNSMNQVFKDRCVDSENLLRAIQVLHRRDWQAQPVRLFDTARCAELEMVESVIHGDYEGNIFRGMGGVHSFSEATWFPGTRRLAERAAISVSSQQIVSEAITSQEESIRYLQTLKNPPSSWPQDSLAPMPKSLDEKYPVLGFFDFRPLGGNLMEAGLFHPSMEVETEIEVARTALACKAFHNEEGRWPETLDEVVPVYIDPLPADLYVDKPLIYRPQEGGFIVYSVGRNQTDDGGGEDDRVWEELVSSGVSEE